MSKYHRGYLPDPPHHQVNSAKARLKRINAQPHPKKFSYRDSIRFILDQGPTSSCVGHAIVGAIHCMFDEYAMPCPDLSPMSVYTPARCLDRVPNHNGILPPLTDDGSMPNQAMRSINEFGIETWQNWPTDPATVNDEPNLLNLENQLQFRVTGQYEITSMGKERAEELKSTLFNIGPACAATQVDTPFEEWDPTGDPITIYNPADNLGGHYIYIIGYEELPDGRTIWEFPNSWGTLWGDNGYGRADDLWMEVLNDMYAMNVSLVDS